MQITHLGHSCLLVEAGDTRLVIDPGVYSAGFETLVDIDAVIITHQHPDHLDSDRLPPLLTANPGAVVLAEPETATLIGDEPGLEATPLIAGEAVRLGSVTVTPLGDRHAFNHDQVPDCGNRGVIIAAEGAPRLFHPGDAYDADPGEVEVLALPINAPWSAVRDTLDFVRRVGPRTVIPIHDGLLSNNGRSSYLMHVSRFGAPDAEIADLSDGTPRDF